MHSSCFPGTQHSNILTVIPSEVTDKAEEIARFVLGGGVSCSRTLSTTRSTNVSINVLDIGCSTPLLLPLLSSRSLWSYPWCSSSILPWELSSSGFRSTSSLCMLNSSSVQQLHLKITSEILKPAWYPAHSCLLLQKPVATTVLLCSS